MEKRLTTPEESEFCRDARYLASETAPRVAISLARSSLLNEIRTICTARAS